MSKFEHGPFLVFLFYYLLSWAFTIGGKLTFRWPGNLFVSVFPLSSIDFRGLSVPDNQVMVISTLRWQLTHIMYIYKLLFYVNDLL